MRIRVNGWWLILSQSPNRIIGKRFTLGFCKLQIGFWTSIECYKSKSGIGIVFLLLSLAILTQSVLAITTSGTLTQDEIWTGKVLITGDVVIPKGITLTVQAGTFITFSGEGSDNDVETAVLNELWLGKSNLI